MKRFYVQQNIGKAKYVVNFHDGEKKHKDGSDFFDVRLFKNFPSMITFCASLTADGYDESSNLK